MNKFKIENSGDNARRLIATEKLARADFDAIGLALGAKVRRCRVRGP